MSAGLRNRLPTIRVRLRHASTPPAPGQCHISDDMACRTPTSSENKIPTIFTCPPAPKKSRPSMNVSCKRKLEFFEINGLDEIESFFKESFECVDVKKKQRNY